MSIQKIIDKLRSSPMSAYVSTELDKIEQELSKPYEAECNCLQCPHRNVFLDDNCGGQGLDYCLLAKEAQAFTQGLKKVMPKQEKERE